MTFYPLLSFCHTGQKICVPDTRHLRKPLPPSANRRLIRMMRMPAKMRIMVRLRPVQSLVMGKRLRRVRTQRQTRRLCRRHRTPYRPWAAIRAARWAVTGCRQQPPWTVSRTEHRLPTACPRIWATDSPLQTAAGLCLTTELKQPRNSRCRFSSYEPCSQQWLSRPSHVDVYYDRIANAVVKKLQNRYCQCCRIVSTGILNPENPPQETLKKMIMTLKICASAANRWMINILILNISGLFY